MPWEMALRVVSLPATSSQDEERRDLGVREPLAVDLRPDERRRQVFGRALQALGGEPLHDAGERHARLEEGRERVVLILDQLRVAAGEHDVGHREDQRPVLRGHAHHVADDPQRDRGGDVGDDVDAAVAGLGLGLRAGGVEHVLDDLLDRPDELLEHPRGEDLRHDAPDLGVPRVVHADQRAVELVEVGRDVGDRHRALAGAEHRRLGADGVQVGVPRHGVVARARLQHRHQGLGEERERPLPAEQVEDGVPLGRRAHPEVAVGQVDAVQLDRRRPCDGVHGHGVLH